VQVDPPMISDHSAIVAELDLPLRRSPGVVHRVCVCRCWRSFSFDDFVRDVEQSPLVQSPSSDVAELYALYDTTLRLAIDKHAPFKVTRMRASESSARWYNAECRMEKVKTRRLEKIYRRIRTAESLAAWRQQFAFQRAVFERRFASFWTETISDNRHDLRALWSQVNVLLKPTPSSTTQSLSADDFANHFTAKVDGIRSATECAPPPDIMHRAVPRLSDFDPVTTKEVIDIMNKLPPKHCDLDPVPTRLLKKAAPVMAPVIGAMCNASLSAGVLPASQKHALVRPLLKKSTLDPDDLCSY